MSAPKSVVKMTKDGFRFEDNVDACNYYIYELTRAALRDVGKLLKKTFREKYYARFKRNTGQAGKATKVKVWSSKTTKYPRLEIGLPTGKVPGFYSYFQEFGTSKTKKLGLLTESAQSNIKNIVAIESKYLSGLSGEAERLNAMIDEGDYDE